MRQLTLCLGFLLGLLYCKAQPKDNDLASFIQYKGDSLYKAGNLPGLLVGVITNGRREYYEFGYAVPDQKIAFDAAVLFEAGSITKTFTAYIVEKVLQEKG